MQVNRLTIRVMIYRILFSIFQRNFYYKRCLPSKQIAVRKMVILPNFKIVNLIDRTLKIWFKRLPNCVYNDPIYTHIPHTTMMMSSIKLKLLAQTLRSVSFAHMATFICLACELNSVFTFYCTLTFTLEMRLRVSSVLWRCQHANSEGAIFKCEKIAERMRYVEN